MDYYNMMAKMGQRSTWNPACGIFSTCKERPETGCRAKLDYIINCWAFKDQNSIKQIKIDQRLKIATPASIRSKASACKGLLSLFLYECCYSYRSCWSPSMFFHSCCCCCALAAHKEHHANTCPLNRTESSWIRLNWGDQASTCMHFLKTEPRHVTTLRWSYWWRQTKMLWAEALVQFSQDDALCMCVCVCWLANANTCTCTQASWQVMINALVRVYVYCIGLRGHKAAFTITVWGFAFTLETKHKPWSFGGRTVQQPLVFTLRYLVIKLIIGLENNLHQMDS